MATYYNYSYEKHDCINNLRKILDQKVKNFWEEARKDSGYYYLTDLMDRVPQLNFRNYDRFCCELSLVVQEFPVENNGKVIYADYFTQFHYFRKYIKKEFGLVHKNRTFNRRFWQWFLLLFVGLSIIITPWFGGILGFLSALFFANVGEQISRDENIVLGLSPKEKQIEATKKKRMKHKAFQQK